MTAPHLELENEERENSPLCSNDSTRKLCTDKDDLNSRKDHLYLPYFNCFNCFVKTLAWTLLLGSVISLSVVFVKKCRQAFSITSSNSNELQATRIRIAFLGNSMIYYNDLPRLLERVSNFRIQQRSCLHGGTTLTKILLYGNGMFQKFNTPNSFIEYDESVALDAASSAKMYDFGDCTVPQLLLGFDEHLNQQVHDKTGYLFDDGSNPCLQNGRYFDWLNGQHYQWGDDKHALHWDYVFMNDNTRNPGRLHTRNDGLQVLNSTYLPMIRHAKATPIFLHTHAYWTNVTDMAELASSEDDMPKFTSLTYEGYRQYAELLGSQLPASKSPRIAPVGIAFLLIWEENREFWRLLFHSDHLHASPLGSFLTACVVHHTIFHELPSSSRVVLPDMSELWNRARVMQQADAPPNPFPTQQQADYLYEIAYRVAVQGHMPKSFVPRADLSDFVTSNTSITPDSDGVRLNNRKKFP